MPKHNLNSGPSGLDNGVHFNKHCPRKHFLSLVRASNCGGTMIDIRGTWICTSSICSRIAAKESVVRSMKVEFTDDHYKMYRDGKLLYAGRYILDCERDPVIIQIFDLDTQKFNSQSLISFDGTVLMLCGTLFSSELPKSFASEKNSWVDLKTLKRLEEGSAKSKGSGADF